MGYNFAKNYPLIIYWLILEHIKLVYGERSEQNFIVKSSVEFDLFQSEKM